MNRIIKYLCNPFLFMARLDAKGIIDVPDKLYVEQIYKERMGRKLNLDNPITYTEKLQWIKLYDHNPIYTTIVDKYKAKEYISCCIGEQYIIPNLGVWDSFNEINFDILPNQFVLKTTHDSGGVFICKDKATINMNKAKEVINNSLKRDYFRLGREWPYKNVVRRIIAEPYLEDSKTGELRDYKFFCFNGNVPFLFVATDRQNRDEPCFDFFDSDYNHLDIRNGHPLASTIPEKPESFEKMKELSQLLSKNFTELRVDFYEVDGKPYVGELTLFHHGGWMPFEPEKWDGIFGDYIMLPK